jgi:hypothetical protein
MLLLRTADNDVLMGLRPQPAPDLPSRRLANTKARSQGFLCPLANHAGLQCGDSRHSLQHESPGWPFDLGQVAEPNVNASLDKTRQEGQGAGQPIDLRDDKRNTKAGSGQRVSILPYGRFGRDHGD